MKNKQKTEEIIKKGTVRTKAAYFVSNWEDRVVSDEPTLITQGEADAIIKSLKNEKERDAFHKYVDIYYQFLGLVSSFGLVETIYKGIANQIIGYLRQVEAYIQEENHLNTLFRNLQELGDMVVTENFLSSVMKLKFKDAKICINDGRIDIDFSEFWKHVDEDMPELYFSCQQYKCIIAATKEFMTEKKIASFAPHIITDSIASAAKDYSLEVSPRFSRKKINERIARGEKVTDREIKLAVFPDFDEIKTPESIINIWREKIKRTFDR